MEGFMEVFLPTAMMHFGVNSLNVQNCVLVGVLSEVPGL